jgi:Uncharacterized protein conserved in bacteria (DUF2334)
LRAEYLLRFDDLCPTMDRERWMRYAPMVERYGIRPILSVVPANRDPQLDVAPEDATFWEAMRSAQAAGATIGLHGYRHLCMATGRGYVPLHRRTEFAGVGRKLQREWIKAGSDILHREGLDPRIWVAPRHGLDRITLEALREVGISLVSDGLAERPFRLGGLTWIPQQLWSPVAQPHGLWTICIHANTATDAQVEEMERFLRRWSGQFTTVERVVEEWPVRERSLADGWFQTRMLARARLRRWKSAGRRAS